MPSVRSFPPLPPASPAPPARRNPAIVTKSSHEFTISAQSSATSHPFLEALRSFRKGVQWLIYGPVVERFTTRRVEDDPDTRYAPIQKVREAAGRIEANRETETIALEKLGPRAAAYHRLVKTLEGDTMARDALQTMLLDGRLTDTQDLKNQGDALSHLTRMNEGLLASGLDRKELLSHVVEEAENPVKIAQEERGTCVATTVTVLLATKNPAEYLRLVADLARPAGTTTTLSGANLTRKYNWASDGDGHRTPSVRLLQPALMELGNGFWRYSNDRDIHTLPVGVPENPQTGGVHNLLNWLGARQILPGGLTAGGANKLLEKLMGQDFQIVNVSRFNRDRAWSRIEAAVSAGQSVPAGLIWNEGGHEVLIEGIRDDRVYYTNPWGQDESMAVGEFKQNLSSANLLRAASD
ncbi:MAG: hypothetical protein VKN33_01545 [Candidatus Sericytochromatia bacterium]|nr:hypothetical protein [Candidatus Sericytochromatia bacterium]